MSERSKEERPGQSNEDLGHKLYRGKTTIAALILLVIGFGGIVLGSTVLHDNIGHYISRDIGIAALTGAVLGTAYEYLLRRDFVRDVRNNIRGVSRERYEVLDQLDEAGLKKLHNSLSNEQLLKKKFDEIRLKAQEYRLRERRHRQWAQRYRPNAPFPEEPPRLRILQTWSGGHRLGGIMENIEKAAEAGCKVQILFLDPSSNQVPGRADALKNLDYTVDEIKIQIKGDLSNLSRICAKEEYDLEARVYDAAPAIHIYDFDGTRIIGVHWRGCASISGPQFEVVSPKTDSDKRSELARRIDKHFEDLWYDDSITREASEALEELKNQGSQGVASEARVTQEGARRVLQAAIAEARGVSEVYVHRGRVFEQAKISDVEEFLAIAHYLAERQYITNGDIDYSTFAVTSAGIAEAAR